MVRRWLVAVVVVVAVVVGVVVPAGASGSGVGVSSGVVPGVVGRVDAPSVSWSYDQKFPGGSSAYWGDMSVVVDLGSSTSPGGLPWVVEASAVDELPSAKVPEAHIPLSNFRFVPEVFGP